MDIKLIEKTIDVLDSTITMLKEFQKQTNMPYQFEVGKIYKMVNNNENLNGEKDIWFFNFKSWNEESKLVNFFWLVNCSNRFVENSSIGTPNVTFSPAIPSEYFPYLPDGHPDKTLQLSIKGAWYEVVEVFEWQEPLGIKIKDIVQCVQENDLSPYCALNGKEVTPTGGRYSFSIYQLRHLPDYTPPVKTISLLDNSLGWVKWLEESSINGLNEPSRSQAIRDIYTKINEIIVFLNNSKQPD